MYHNDNVSVSFEEDGNFTYQEKEYFYKILNDVKPEYLESTKGIHVLMENDKRKYLGKNKWGEIWVEYNDDPVFLKMVLCHELLHNINLIDKNATEVIIKDLSAEGVCYIYEDDGN